MRLACGDPLPPSAARCCPTFVKAPPHTRLQTATFTPMWTHVRRSAAAIRRLLLLALPLLSLPVRRHGQREGEVGQQRQRAAALEVQHEALQPLIPEVGRTPGVR